MPSPLHDLKLGVTLSSQPEAARPSQAQDDFEAAIALTVISTTHMVGELRQDTLSKNAALRGRPD